MADGSSVHIKVAQYFVDKKLRELESTDPQIKIDDWTFLQALPQFESSVDEATQGVDEPAHDVDVDQPAQLPPLFPGTGGDADHVSWKRLLEHNNLRTNGPPEKPGSPGSPPKQPTFPPGRRIHPPWYYVAIIGAGVAGLRTAKLLQDMGIPYKIFEASAHPGGRVFTYQFPSKPPGNPQGAHDYYDVGAMRFPDNDSNKRTFALFKELGLSDKMIEYVLSRDDNIRYYNNIKSTTAVANTAGDHFKDKIVPKEYLNKECTDLRGKKVYGVNACTVDAFDPFRKALIDDFDKGWKKLMEYDWASTRSYLTREKPNYPLSVVHWMESRNSGTGGFDRAFSDAILESLVFNDPTKDVKWWCFEGGSKVLIDAMLDKLIVEPSYGQRVTSIKSVYLPPHEWFPTKVGEKPRRWPRFPFMKVGVAGKREEYFTHVVSTVSFADLGTIDTNQVHMTYKQRQAIRTLNYGPAVKVAIKFKTRWWEQAGVNQRGGCSFTDRQSRMVVYPSCGMGEEGPGVLMVSYNWHQDASRFGALIQNPDWSKQLDPDRKRSQSEQVLLDQIYEDLAALHGVAVDWLRKETLDYHAFDWYHSPYTMGAYAQFAPGQYSTFYADIVQPAAYGRFHFAGEVASTHHGWVAGALDSAVRVVDEILRWDFPFLLPKFKKEYGRSLVFSDDKSAEAQFVKGLFSKELEEAERMYN